DVVEGGEVEVGKHHVAALAVAGDEAVGPALEDERRADARGDGVERLAGERFVEAVAGPERARYVTRAAEPARRSRFAGNGRGPRAGRGKAIVVVGRVHGEGNADVPQVALARGEEQVAAREERRKDHGPKGEETRAGGRCLGERSQPR